MKSKHDLNCIDKTQQYAEQALDLLDQLRISQEAETDTSRVREKLYQAINMIWRIK